MWDFHCGAPLRRLLALVRVGCAGLFLGFSQTIRFRGLPGSPGSVTVRRKLAACAGGALGRMGGQQVEGCGGCCFRWLLLMGHLVCQAVVQHWGL